MADDCSDRAGAVGAAGLYHSARTRRTTPHPPVQIRLLHGPGCPLLHQLRAVLQDCLQSTGIRADVEDVEGSYPSPTLLIDGVDVVTGQPPARDACCRLDLPTHAQIMTALREGAPQ